MLNSDSLITSLDFNEVIILNLEYLGDNFRKCLKKLSHEQFQNGGQGRAKNTSLGKVCSIVWASGTFGFLSGTVIKNPANAGDAREAGLIPGSGRSPGRGNGYLFQYSCLKNPMVRGSWRTTVYGFTRIGHDEKFVCRSGSNS